MADKIKLRERTGPATGESNAEVHSQRRPLNHRYLLQVDRQTKASYPTMETATTAGMIIKKRYPIVRVSVYDTVKSTDTQLTAADAF